MRNILVRGTIKVLIVDDSSTIRAMMVRLLEQHLDFEVIGVAASADQAEAMIDRDEPDVITLDHEMPGKTGLEFLGQFMAEGPQRIVMVSSHAAHDSSFRDKAMALGAKGCFDKAAVLRDSSRFVQLLRRAAKRPVTSLSNDIRALHNIGLLDKRTTQREAIAAELA
jgi:two-component system chemotaxis response regulator CheB